MIQAGRFDLFIGIDYSGAETPEARLKGLQVYAARPGGPCEKWFSPAPSNNGKTSNWTRAEIAGMLLDQAKQGVRFLAGIDHGFSFPLSYFERYGLKSWPEFLGDLVGYFPADQPGVALKDIDRAARTGDTRDLRLCERWTSSAKSVFLFDVQGSVAKSTHAGIPWLKRLRDEAGDRIHFWPFDGWQPSPGKAVIAEVYPSIFRKRYPVEGRSGDEQDAYAVARWLTSPFENLTGFGKPLKAEPPDAKELAGLCRFALVRLRDAEYQELSLEGRFDLAYNAAHALCLAALRRHGYRSTNRYIVFQLLPHTLGLGPEVWRVLAKCHDVRNLGEYEGDFNVDERLVTDLIAACRKVAERLESLPPL